MSATRRDVAGAGCAVLVVDVVGGSTGSTHPKMGCPVLVVELVVLHPGAGV